MKELLNAAASAPRHVQALVATIVALVGVTVWAVPQLLDLRDQIAYGRLERVNLLAADELFGAEPVEACRLESIETEVFAYTTGVLVKVRSDKGTRQRQFFPRDGIDSFLASRSETAFAFTGLAYAQEPPTQGVGYACKERLEKKLSQRTALVSCTYPDGCIEFYVIDLATGELLDLRSKPCRE